MRYRAWAFAPAHGYRLTGWVFLRLLALIYFVAFSSLLPQLAGLIGPDGVLPYGEFLAQAQERHGYRAWLLQPSLFWVSASDLALQSAAVAGCGFSLLLLFAKWERLALIALFVLYLSLRHAGQIFLNFQWDYLLLETGFLAIFLVAGPTRLLVFLFHLLLFRLRFLSGLFKLGSGDPAWIGFTALNYYFETQPLPHIGSWYAHQLPAWLLQVGAGFTLFAELLVPFFIFMPRRFRLFAAAVTILMQLLIIATSNHNFINLLTILLCLFLLDDRVVARLLPAAFATRLVAASSAPGTTTKILTGLSLLLIVSASVPMLGKIVSGYHQPALLEWSAHVRAFGIGNIYHLFPTMQTERHELEIQGSNDGQTWQTYTFKFKPSALDRPPKFIVPHQPRLDWMIWFVPPQPPDASQWFDRFMFALAQGRQAVTGLLANNPFPDRPPKYLRVLSYRYEFTDFAEFEVNGYYWKRELLGEFPHVPARNP